MHTAQKRTANSALPVRLAQAFVSWEEEGGGGGSRSSSEHNNNNNNNNNNKNNKNNKNNNNQQCLSNHSLERQTRPCKRSS